MPGMPLLLGKCLSWILIAFVDSAPIGRKSSWRLLETSVRDGEIMNKDNGNTIQARTATNRPRLEVTDFAMILNIAIVDWDQVPGKAITVRWTLSVTGPGLFDTWESSVYTGLAVGWHGYTGRLTAYLVGIFVSEPMRVGLSWLALRRTDPQETFAKNSGETRRVEENNPGRDW